MGHWASCANCGRTFLYEGGTIAGPYICRECVPPHTTITRGTKRLLLLTFLTLTIGIFANAQCVDDANSLCIPRADVARATAAAIELKAARAVIDAFSKEREATEAERASAARLIDRLNAVIALQDRMSVEYEKALTLYKKVLDEAFALIDRQAKMLARGKSSFDRFLSALKTVASIVVGISIGRGL